MRYYALSLTNPSGQPLQVSTGGAFVTGGKGPTFTSLLPNGQTNPGALCIEFDCPVSAYHQPQGNFSLTVHGVGLQMVGQAAQLSGGNFTLAAGMSAGLPLANPSQRGVIATGTIFQGFGNWQGVEQTLDLICIPGSPILPNGLAFSWVAGQPLSQALTATFTQALPGYAVSVNVLANLMPPGPQYGCYPKLSSFAQWLQQYTQPLGAAILGAAANYPGVSIAFDGTTVRAFDSTVPVGKLVQLNFQDLIGQPTWIGLNQINFKTVLRADIDIGNQIKFPTGLMPPYALLTSDAAFPNAPARSKTAFQGAFTVVEIHHFANSRQPDADSWCTGFVALAQTAAAA